MAKATGRMAPNNPNLQNIPIRTDIGQGIRKAFVVDSEYEVAVDYSQIELRLLAHLSFESVFIEALQQSDLTNEKVPK